MYSTHSTDVAENSETAIVAVERSSDEGSAASASGSEDDESAAPSEAAPAAAECSPHMPPERSVEVPELNQQCWVEHGGEALEEVLSCGAIALVDAKWLVEWAAAGKVLKRRQELPPEAFITLDELKAACPGRCLPIIALSYRTHLGGARMPLPACLLVDAERSDSSLLGSMARARASRSARRHLGRRGQGAQVLCRARLGGMEAVGCVH